MSHSRECRSRLCCSRLCGSSLCRSRLCRSIDPVGVPINVVFDNRIGKCNISLPTVKQHTSYCMMKAILSSDTVPLRVKK